MSMFIKGGLLANIYHWLHPLVPQDKIPYWYKRSIIAELLHLIKKIICQNIAPNCVTNFMRINLYRLCGFTIGKGTFIGMKCYMDDLCTDKVKIGKKVIISYGTYFACHGKGQGHNNLIIEDGAYIGMRCSIIARHDGMVIGKNSVIGANSLVNKDIPAFSVAYGNPVEVRRMIQTNGR